MDNDKTAEKLNPALPLDIERERSLFEAHHFEKYNWTKDHYRVVEDRNSDHCNGTRYERSEIQFDFEDWLACASVPRPIPAEPAQSPKPIGQAWGIWCERPDGKSGFINHDGIITQYPENEIDRVVISFNEMNLHPWYYEKRRLYIYDAPQPAQAQAAPTIDQENSNDFELVIFKNLPIGARFKYIGGADVWVVRQVCGCGSVARWGGNILDYRGQVHCSAAKTPEECRALIVQLLPDNFKPKYPKIEPNAWLPFKDAPKDDHRKEFDLWDTRNGRISDCYYRPEIQRWMQGSRAISTSNITHFMVVNPPIDSDNPEQPTECPLRCRNYLREQGLPRERKCEVCGFGECKEGK